MQRLQSSTYRTYGQKICCDEQTTNDDVLSSAVAPLSATSELSASPDITSTSLSRLRNGEYNGAIQIISLHVKKMCVENNNTEPVFEEAMLLLARSSAVDLVQGLSSHVSIYKLLSATLAENDVRMVPRLLRAALFPCYVIRNSHLAGATRHQQQHHRLLRPL